MRVKSLLLSMALLAASPASAATYMFSYTTFDGISASGTFVTEDTQSFGGYLVTDVTGARQGDAITGYDFFADSDQLLFPSGPRYVDGSGITYEIGDYSYNIYDSGGLYQEFVYLTADGGGGPGIGHTISSFTVTPAAPAVPEPATWAMMVAGFGFVGSVLRRRAAPALAW